MHGKQYIYTINFSFTFEGEETLAKEKKVTTKPEAEVKDYMKMDHKEVVCCVY
jgi:hypothetical protein